MSWRGNWGAPAIYRRNDVVIGSDDRSYVCTVTSSVLEEPSVTPSAWQPLGGGGGGGSGGITAVTTTGTGSGIVAATSQEVVTLSTALAAGAGIDLAPSVSDENIVISNTGILDVQAGTGLSVNVADGVATLANTGIVSVQGGAGVTVATANGVATITSTATPTLPIAWSMDIWQSSSPLTATDGAIVTWNVTQGGLYLVSVFGSITASANDSTHNVSLSVQRGGGGLLMQLVSVPSSTTATTGAWTAIVPADSTSLVLYVAGQSGGPDGSATIYGGSVVRVA